MTGFVLRAMRGVADIEALLVQAESHPNPNWAPQRAQAEALAAKVTERLFGNTDADTRYQPDHLLSKMDNEHHECVWEQDFDFLREPFEAQAEVWTGEGWDVTDGDGKPLRALELLGRCIVATWYDIGHEPEVTDELTAVEASDIEAKLRAEAAKFRPKR